MANSEKAPTELMTSFCDFCGAETSVPLPTCAPVAADSAEHRETVARLNAQIASLSSQLEQLDDQLADSEHALAAVQLENEACRERIDLLEETVRGHEELVESSRLVDSSKLEALELQLKGEQAARGQAEASRQLMESELEELTQRLFEVSSDMVKEEHERRQESEQHVIMLEEKLADLQTILQTLESEKQQLKSILHTMDTEKRMVERELDDALSMSQPSTPTGSIHRVNSMRSLRNSRRRPNPLIHDSSYYSSDDSSSPYSPPLNHGLHLIDSKFFHEYLEFIESCKADRTGKPMREAKFMKRVLYEDVEPCLNFDPNVSSSIFSWNQPRKTVLAAVLENTLIIEPFAHPSSPSAVNHARTALAAPLCTLCNTAITSPISFVYRLSDTDTKRQPMCAFCRARLTSVCEFYGFVRMISTGVLPSKGGGPSGNAQRSYREVLRLRERMLWARLGCGVDLGEPTDFDLEDEEPQLVSNSDLDIVDEWR